MDHITIFIAVTSAAVVIQAGILLGMFLGMRKTSAKVEALAEEVRTRVLPTADLVQSTLIELRPKIESIVADVSESTAMVKAQMKRLDATVGDVIDRTRLQVIRADELVNRTLDQVEDATEMVHDTVVSPVRQLSGLLKGLTAAVEFLIGRRRGGGDGVNVPQDEMFI